MITFVMIKRGAKAIRKLTESLVCQLQYERSRPEL